MPTASRDRRARRRSFAPEALEARRLLAYGLPGTAFEVGGARPGEDGFRSAVDFRGRVTVVWEAGDGSGWGVFARRYDAAGNALGDASRLNVDATGDQVAARVVADDSGATVVAWWSGSQRHFRRYDPEGAPIGGEGVLPGSQGLPRDFELYGQDGGGFAVYADGFQLRWYGADGALLRASAAQPHSDGWTAVESQAPGRALMEEDGSGALLTWSESTARMSGGSIVYDVRVVTGEFAPDGSLTRRDVHATAPGLADASLAAEQEPTILRVATGSTFPGTEWRWLLVWRARADYGPTLRANEIVPNGIPQGGPYELGGADYGAPTAIAATTGGRVVVHYVRPGATDVRASHVQVWTRWTSTFPWNEVSWVVVDSVSPPGDRAGSFQELQLVPTVAGDFWILRDDGAGTLLARRLYQMNGNVQFARAGLSVGEAEGRVVSWLVRYGDLRQQVKVPYFTYDVGAFPGYDFVPLSGTLTFEPGRSEAAVVLTVLDDHAPDPNKAVILGLGSPSGSVQRIDLVDDEPAGAYDLAFADYGAYGLWIYNDLLGWAKINDADPRRSSPPRTGRATSTSAPTASGRGTASGAGGRSTTWIPRPWWSSGPACSSTSARRASGPGIPTGPGSTPRTPRGWRPTARR